MAKNKSTDKPAKVEPERGQQEKAKVELPETVAEEQTNQSEAGEVQAIEMPAGEQTGQGGTSESAGIEPVLPTNFKAKNKQGDFIAPYVKAYPKEKVFYITGDRQVFLEKDRNLAVMHQTSLHDGETVRTVNVN